MAAIQSFSRNHVYFHFYCFSPIEGFKMQSLASTETVSGFVDQN